MISMMIIKHHINSKELDKMVKLKLLKELTWREITVY